MEINCVIDGKYEGMQIQSVLRHEFFMSNTAVKKCKLYGEVDLNGEHAFVKAPVHSGDLLHVKYDDDTEISHDNDIRFYFENSNYAVVEKPAGMVTHPTHGHLDDSLLTILNAGDKPLHPVMRLDRETSGLIIVAKNGYAHNTLHKFGNIEKRYLAVVYGCFSPLEGTIDKPIARRANSVMIREINPDGRRCVTHYKTLLTDKSNEISLVEFKLDTGRCHQIRVHSNSMGHPLVGDGLYGPNSEDNPRECKGIFGHSKELDGLVGRTALHAYSLRFEDPMDSGRTHEYISPPPEDMLKVFDGESRQRIDQMFCEGH